jgi:predicted PurR-regulated permease PerM
MPYAVLISVIVGVTNIIPFFGPYIGAIPSALLVLTVSPVKCIVFVVFIIVLQQLDGNYIGPRILGDRLGISGIWILLSIMIFSSLLGFVGMLIGVPVFAVIYDLIRRGIYRLLNMRGEGKRITAYETTYHPGEKDGKNRNESGLRLVQTQSAGGHTGGE